MKASRLLGVVAACPFACGGVPAVAGLASRASADVIAAVIPPGTMALSGLEGRTKTLSVTEPDAMPRMSDRVILADRMEGAPLAAKRGPFQVIVESDLRPARSARVVSATALKRVR